MLGKSEARSLASQIVAGEQPVLWDAICDVYEISEETCTIAQLIKILEEVEPQNVNPLIR